MGKPGKTGQTIGFHYIMTLLWGDCRGPVNEYLAVEVDDKLAWVGNADGSSPVSINNPDLFGGEKKEGGIQGAFRLLQGARDQIVPGPTDVYVGFSGPVPTATIPDIRASIGGRVSQLRGFVSGVWRGLVSSMNPYPKEWHFLRWRTDAGWFGGTAWYPEKATIWLNGDGHALADGSDPTTTFGSVLPDLVSEVPTLIAPTVDNRIRAMNPAHMIYQALTDPEWGASRSPEELDENSFILAANALCAESFGLCINWARQEDIDVFIQSVIDHIAGALYTDRTTGKLVLKLIRDDYNVDDLPHYDFNSGLLSIEEDDSASSDEMINEIIVKGKDQSVVGRGMDLEVRVHNNSARQAQGTISTTLEYPGLPTRDLAARRGQMELRIHAPGLKRFKLTFDRRAWQIVPAGVVRISAPSNGIANMVIRFGDDIDYGNTTSGTITASAVEDVFGLPSASFQSVGGSTWVPPNQAPLPATATELIEAGYRDMVKRVGTAQTNALHPTATYIGQLAVSPGGTAYQFDLLSRAAGEPDFVDRGTGAFTQRLLLSASVAALDTAFPVASIGDLSTANLGEALLVGNEIVRLDGIVSGILTVARGCADTVPAAHASGAGLWTVDDDLVPDGREYASGETVETQVLTRTSSGLLDPTLAATDSIDVVARHYKPYPPANVKINGTSIYALSGAYADPVLTFTDRDRLSENDQLLEHGASSIGPEAGTTYTLRVKSSDGTTLLRTETVTSGWTYDAAKRTADGNPVSVIMELESTRGGIASWQMYSFSLELFAADDWQLGVFLSGFEGGSVIDESPLAQTVTLIGATAASSAHAKYGTESLGFPSSGDGGATVPHDAAMNFGSGPFTAEAWMYLSSTPGPFDVYWLLAKSDADDLQAGWDFFYSHRDSVLQIDIRDQADASGTNTSITGAFVSAINTWQHLAVDFDGTKYRLYANGVMVGSSTSFVAVAANTAPLSIGTGLSTGFSYGPIHNGYLDEARVTKGRALYASDAGFTPPAAPFPRV